MPHLTTEIANLWKQGLSAQEIADRLGVPYERVAEAIGAAPGAAPEDMEDRDRTEPGLADVTLPGMKNCGSQMGSYLQ